METYADSLPKERSQVFAMIRLFAQPERRGRADEMFELRVAPKRKIGQGRSQTPHDRCLV